MTIFWSFGRLAIIVQPDGVIDIDIDDFTVFVCLGPPHHVTDRFTSITLVIHNAAYMTTRDVGSATVPWAITTHGYTTHQRGLRVETSAVFLMLARIRPTDSPTVINERAIG